MLISFYLALVSTYSRITIAIRWPKLHSIFRQQTQQLVLIRDSCMCILLRVLASTSCFYFGSFPTKVLECSLSVSIQY
jgi:hypothetical protein